MVSRPAGASLLGTTEYLLPPAAYHSAEWLDREQDLLFGGRWALIASLEELAAPGDFATGSIGRAPVVVVRDGEGGLRAFHNLCRHRGMRLLQGAGHLTGTTINCFYHQWRYGLDGDLKVVPQRKEQFPDLVLDDWGLLPAAVEVWQGMVFVHPDPFAEPLSETLGELPRHMGSVRPGRLRQGPTVRLVANCNWKLFVENHVDVYHLWYLHADSLGDYDHNRFEHQQLGANWASYEPLRNGDLRSAALTAGTVPLSHLDERDRLGLGAHLVFPNLMMAVGAEFFASYVAEPLAPDHSVIELRVRTEEGADAAAVTESVQSFIREDIEACEAIQAAVASPAFGVGPLARDHEAPITAFHRNLIDAVGVLGS